MNRHATRQDRSSDRNRASDRCRLKRDGAGSLRSYVVPSAHQAFRHQKGTHGLPLEGSTRSESQPRALAQVHQTALSI